jgi:anaerobic glycerol-3-phosphate dehydrogenase
VEDRTALDMYGASPHNNLTPLQREQNIQALREAFAEGPHITQVRRRNMDRRIALLVFAAQHDFQPLAARRAELLELHPALPTNVPIPGLPNGTAAERLALLQMRVLGDKDLFRHIVSFD